MAFGYSCVRRLLITLNMFYILLSIILVSVAIYANYISIVESRSVIGGIIFCGTFLFIISFVGLIGTLKHHQVFLFCYMVMLGLCFIIQFVIAVVCLAVITYNAQYDILQASWNKLSERTRHDTQKKYNCCDFTRNSSSLTPEEKDAKGCLPDAEANCYDIVKDGVTKGLKVTGACALVFSFINLSGICLAKRFRNQRNPKYNPNMFL